MAAAPVPAPLPQRPRPGQVSSPGPAAPWAHLQAPRRPPLGRAAGSEGGAGGLRSPDEPRPPAARPRGEGRGRGAGGRRGPGPGERGWNLLSGIYLPVEPTSAPGKERTERAREDLFEERLS